MRIFSLPILMVFLSFLMSPAKALQAPAEVQKGDDAPHLVIIDTDIGDDIDDAFAVALALRSPEMRVIGVTTTFGETELRARLLDRYLAAAGRSDIPVAAGPATVRPNPFTQTAYALHSPEHKHADGPDFILQQIRLHPGKITLIGVGPLFTIQAAIKRDPDTFRKLERVVIMGGSIYRCVGLVDGKPRPACPEWNIDRDPQGARDLLSSGVPVYMMPLDSTQIRLEFKEREQIFSHGSALTDQLTLLYHEWGRIGLKTTPILYDAVAVSYAVRPDLCPATPMHIDVADDGLTTPGKGATNAYVCVQSDEKGFLDLIVHRLTSD